MSKERELLQICLDEFEYKGVACNELCIDINKLLAQPEQEPVAWMFGNKLYKKPYGKNHLSLEERNSFIPLYTAPPKREPLSDEEIHKLSLENFKGLLSDRINFGRAIEKAHGIGGGE